LFTSGKNIDLLINNLTKALENIHQWLSQHGLHLSCNKSKIILFSRKRNLPEFTIKINGEDIPLCNDVKFLGIYLNRKLSWNTQIDHIVNTCERSINVLRAVSRVWWGAHPSTMKLFYNALVRSRIDYGSFLLEPIPQYLETKLNRVQSKCLRLILGAMRSSPVNALQVEAVEMPLNIRRMFLANRFLIKKINNTNHPLIHALKNSASNLSARQRTQGKIPTLVSSFEYVSSLDTNEQNIAVPPLFNIPYNCIVFTPQVIEDFGIDKHTNLSPSLINSFFNSLVESKLTEYTIIFTDGSKMDNSCGASLYVPSRKHSVMVKLISFYG
jgi:hypothetical protein